MPVVLSIRSGGGTGAARVGKQLDKFGRKGRRVLIRHTEALGLKIRNHAVKSILQGSPTGRVYGRHRASAPGQPPASDTGDLAGHIFAETGSKGRQRFVDVGTTKAHGLYLELGTDRIEPRPWLQPAYDKQSRHTEKELLSRMRRELK